MLRNYIASSCMIIKHKFIPCTKSAMITGYSPQEVLRGILARTVPAPTLARIFFAAQFTRHLDQSGSIRFPRWRFYAEAGLAKKGVQVSISTSTLKVEYEETELAFYTVA